MKLHIVPASLVLLVALAGCSSSTPSDVAASAPDTVASSSGPTTASPTLAATPSPTEAPEPVAGGTATDFCGAFQELQAVSDTPTGDMASVGAQMRGAAADMRKYAPADVEKAANTYADVIDNIGKLAASGTLDKAALSKAISDGMSGKAEDIGAVAMWVGKNCDI